MPIALSACKKKSANNTPTVRDKESLSKSSLTVEKMRGGGLLLATCRQTNFDKEKGLSRTLFSQPILQLVVLSRLSLLACFWAGSLSPTGQFFPRTPLSFSGCPISMQGRERRPHSRTTAGASKQQLPAAPSKHAAAATAQGSKRPPLPSSSCLSPPALQHT